MWELTKSFRFEAAHALTGTTLGEAGAEVHGHSYRAEVTISGAPDPTTGMIVDVGVLEHRLAEMQKDREQLAFLIRAREKKQWLS